MYSISCDINNSSNNISRLSSIFLVLGIVLKCRRNSGGGGGSNSNDSGERKEYGKILVVKLNVG